MFFVLSLRGVLAERYGLPIGLMTFNGILSVTYSSLGMLLALQERRSLARIRALAAANYLWIGVCVVLIVRFAHDARALGFGHLAFEGVYVATLATVEGRKRRALAHPSS